MNVGTVVVFTGNESNGTREHPAIVTRVWGPGDHPTVNLKVLPDCGEPYDATSVQHVSARAPFPPHRRQSFYRYRSVGTRVAGQRGVRESHAPHLFLNQFRATELAPPPPSGDVTMGLENWTTLGNDVYANCGPAATEHGRMAKALVSVTNGIPTYEPGFAPPHTPYTEGLYFAYGRAMGEPGTKPDEGVTNASWLHWLYTQGLIDWYGELDSTNPDEVHSAMLACRGVLVAVTLTDDAETLFAEHQPWTLAHGEQPDPSEGHDILLVRYSPTGETFVTWGALEEATVPWGSSCITDCWAYGTREDAQRAGYTFEAIRAAIDAAGGTVTGSGGTAQGSSPAAADVGVQIKVTVTGVTDPLRAAAEAGQAMRTGLEQGIASGHLRP